MAEPTLMRVVDTNGVELIYLGYYERTPKHIGRKRFSNYKWIVGGKLCLLLNKWSPVSAAPFVDWDSATANVNDSAFQPMLSQYQEQVVVHSDQLFSLKKGNTRIWLHAASQLCASCLWLTMLGATFTQGLPPLLRPSTSWHNGTTYSLLWDGVHLSIAPIGL